MKRCLKILVCMICSTMFLAHVSAQESPKEVVSIYIQNQNGDNLKQVNIIITDEKAVRKTYTSDDLGRVILHDLSIGEYHIDVSTPRGYKAYEGQNFYVTPYNQKTRIEMTIQLYPKEKTSMMKWDALLLFLSLCNVMLYFILYMFQMDTINNFTQSFDDSMV